MEISGKDNCKLNRCKCTALGRSKLLYRLARDVVSIEKRGVLKHCQRYTGIPAFDLGYVPKATIRGPHLSPSQKWPDLSN